ncbi:uncharacterized protein LOC122397787 isoform X2 [Colletes gigas]|uniref:uncharacterized protein LOC122397787 isoform X2 n=1 Tax=Colletes gigas TaxID=935657 RepID=UPI001C9ACB0D|nr:uncharacterized protein LOC122397787 isoform X2 [Colletes gigas]
MTSILVNHRDGSGELLYYVRCNQLGPKLCTYEKVLLNHVQKYHADTCVNLKNILTKSNGIIGTVKKTRKLYMIDQTRVHIDEVEGLGNFMELEVVLTNEQDLKIGEKIAQDLMAKFNIKSEDLITESYIDLLSKSNV